MALEVQSRVDDVLDRLGTLGEVIRRAREQDILLVAGGLAFYALVSAAPMVIVVLWVVSLVLGDERVQRFAEALGEFAPENMGGEEAVKRVAELGPGAGITALLAAAWPATSYGSGLIRAFERLADGENEKWFRGLRGRGLVLLVLFPVFVFGGLLASLAGTAVLRQATDGQMLGLGIAAVTGFLGAVVVVGLIYRMFPPPGAVGWTGIRRGALATAAAISVMSLAFTAYLRLGADFEERYLSSALAGVVLLALWLFLFNLLLLAGYRLALERD